MWVIANVNTPFISFIYYLFGWDLDQTNEETERLFIWYFLSLVSPEVVILTVCNAENEKNPLVRVNRRQARPAYQKTMCETFL